MVRRLVPILFGALLLLTACGGGMKKQPLRKPFYPSTVFANGNSSRPLVPDTVARGHLNDNDLFHTGMVQGELATEFPMPVTRELVERGHERFDIYCAPCHGLTGEGDGMVPRRGFKNPPTFHQDRLRKAPPGHFVNVITTGFGAMYSYSDRVLPRDRWAIAAYIRALQLSQDARLADVPPAEASKLVREGRP